MNKAGITNKLERAHILSQTAYESGEWSSKTENLNYSEDGLKKLFGKYFPGNSAVQYARQPEKIANRVYANRMGNGGETSGDGWKYRGRGYIQLTGKDNYTAFNNYLKRIGINDNVIKNPDLVATKYSAEASVFWWISNSLGNSRGIRSKAQSGFDSQSVIIITQIVAGANPDKNNILGKIQYFNYFKTENI
jgi:putative chitinase